MKIKVIEEMIQTGSEIIDSMINRISALNKFSNVFFKLDIMPKTTTVLVPPTIAPNNIPCSKVKSSGNNQFKIMPIIEIDAIIDEIDKMVDFIKLPRRVFKSKFNPASNKITPRATILIKGTNAWNKSASIKLKTGPTRIPNPINESMSGTLVFQ